MEELAKNTTREKIAETIKRMVSFMDPECQIEFREETDDRGIKSLATSIHTPDHARLLIGKDGQNIRSLEQVLKAMFLKKITDVDNITVDVNDYKKSRASYVINVAREVITRVRSTQKAEALFPMSSYERRIVHMELAACPDIATESIGAEPNRRIVVKPYP